MLQDPKHRDIASYFQDPRQKDVMSCFEESFFEHEDADVMATAEQDNVARKLGDSMTTASPSKYSASKSDHVDFKLNILL